MKKQDFPVNPEDLEKAKKLLNKKAFEILEIYSRMAPYRSFPFVLPNIVEIGEKDANPYAFVSFSIDELDTIKRAWRELKPEVKDLAKRLFPQINANLLASILFDESMSFLYE